MRRIHEQSWRSNPCYPTPLENIRILEDPETNLKLIMKDGVIYKNTLN